MTEVYSEAQFAQGYPQGSQGHFWHRARNELVWRWLRPLLGSEELALEVGCGGGIVIDYLRGRGLRIRGVELGNPPLPPHLRESVDTNTSVFDLDERTRRQVKVLLLLDVIEHIGERREFLRRLWREFPNSRYLLVTVPARREMWSNYDEYWRHYLRYNRPQLVAELDAGGFQAIATRYFFHWVYLAGMLLKLLGMRRNPGLKAPVGGALPFWLHRLLGILTTLETRLLPGFVAGSSLACVAVRVAARDTGASRADSATPPQAAE